MGEGLITVASQSRASGRARFWLALLYPIIVVALYWETIGSMVSIWQRSDTYAHGYLILPITLCLIWMKRDALSGLKLQPALSVQLLLIPGGLVWLLSYLTDVLVIQQLALVGILIVGIWSIVGHSVARIIAFPLGFLLLAVPMGEDLVPPMMEFTASSTVWLIQLTGIPVYREGLYFTLPSGNWSVVEACSGVRYLIASFTLGLLYAHLTYRSFWRQLLFVLASIIVPVAANTARAYIIVMLGHLSDMTIATGVDHLIYGWVFFGLVMLLLFWIGSFWREDEEISESDKSSAATSGHTGTTVSSVLAVITAIIIAGFWPLFGTAIERSAVSDKDVGLQAPLAADNWSREARRQWDWKPVEAAADAELVAFYRRGDQHIALYIQHYLQQQQGAELVSGKIGQFVAPNKSWRIAERGTTNALLGAQQIKVDLLRLSNSGNQILLWNWYRIGNHYTANAYMAKWYEALEAITFGRQDSSRIILATAVTPEGNGQEVVQAFITAHLPGIEMSLDATVQKSK